MFANPTASSSLPLVAPQNGKTVHWSRRERALCAVAFGNALIAVIAIFYRHDINPDFTHRVDPVQFDTMSAAAIGDAYTQGTKPVPFDSTNRTVVITGASRGIGKGIASVFAKAGARVLINARNLTEAQQTADQIVSAGGIASAVAGDVSSETDMLEVVKMASERYGGIDVMIMNAGIYPSMLLEKMEVKDWDSVMDVNLRGAFLATKTALPYLKKSRLGRVILTSSITGPITGFPGWSHYGASKAGELGFMRSASVELAKYRVTVNAVLPGNVLVETLAALGEDYITKTEAIIPLQRFGTVEEIGYACLFLASKEAGYITGQSIVVDGGQTIPENPGFRTAW